MISVLMKMKYRITCTCTIQTYHIIYGCYHFFNPYYYISLYKCIHCRTVRVKVQYIAYYIFKLAVITLQRLILISSYKSLQQMFRVSNSLNWKCIDFTVSKKYTPKLYTKWQATNNLFQRLVSTLFSAFGAYSKCYMQRLIHISLREVHLL